MVEARGVEPLSLKRTRQITTCLFRQKSDASAMNGHIASTRATTKYFAPERGRSDPGLTCCRRLPHQQVSRGKRHGTLGRESEIVRFCVYLF